MSKPNRKSSAEEPQSAQEEPKASPEGPKNDPDGAETIIVGNFFFHAPLIKGERQEDYDQLYELISESIGPTDFIETLWVKDLTDINWESLRARRLRSYFIEAVRLEMERTALAEGLKMRLGWSDPHRPPDPKLKEAGERAIAAIRRSATDPNSPNAIFDLYKEHRVPFDGKGVTARAYVASIEQLRSVDGLINTLDRRKGSILREIEKRRAAVASSVRDALDDLLRTEAAMKNPPPTVKK